MTAEDAAAGVPLILLRANGALLLDGEATTLGGLLRACAGKAVVRLRVDPATPWARTQWVLAALERAPVGRVQFDLGDDVAEACFRSDFWEQDARHLVGGHTAAVVAVDGAKLTEPWLASHLADEAARIERECRLRPLGELHPAPAQSFADVSFALRAFRSAGVELEFQLWIPGEPVPEKMPPLADDGEWTDIAAGYNPRCSCWPGGVDVDLPVADLGEPDRLEDDESALVDLDRDGNVFFRTRQVTLASLREALVDWKERYALKMRQQRKSAVEELPDGTFASKLYVCIRADHAAPAIQVGWILHVLADERILHVEYCVRRKPEAGPEPCLSAPGIYLESYLSWEDLPRLAGKQEPFARVYVDAGAYGVGPTGSLDIEAVERLVRAEYERARADRTRRLVAAVHVGAGVTWGRVIAAMNAINRVPGTVQIDLHGLPLPDEATRRACPLPR